jgi:predicted nucleic acid-binding protein
MNAAERVVFDCNVNFQAVISRSGPAGQCFAAAQEGKLSLFTSRQVIDDFEMSAYARTSPIAFG